jgi:dTDP-4-dehydrorhamnose reductase
MNRETIAMVGFGDLGERLAARLPTTKWRAIGLRRRAHCVPVGVRGVPIDLRDPATLCCLGDIQPQALVVTLTPQERSAEGYSAGFSGAMGSIIAGLAGHQPRRAIFVSSTRVYAESDGAWVEEDAQLNRDDSFAGAIIDAEERFLEALPGGVILRAAGLYGDGPGRFLRRVAAGKRSAADPLRYTNRIHRDDLAAFMAHLLVQPHSERVYNLVDDAPAPVQDVERWLCEQLQLPYEHSLEPSSDQIDASPVVHKRVRNSRLHASGFELAYPTYREGYGAVLRRWMAHSEREDGLDLH